MALALNQLQQQLERLYEIQIDYAVEDFLISDRHLAEQIQGDASARAVAEKLLVQQDENGLGLTLYLDAALLERLRSDNPFDCLHDQNLADFCLALEGVSHFLYLVWNAQQRRCVSCLELEMQAEVDKYVTIVQVLAQQYAGLAAPELHRWLFEEVSFDSALSDREHLRYRDANHYAGKYCWQLERRLRTCRDENILPELRRFYRLSLAHKIRQIDKLN